MGKLLTTGGAGFIGSNFVHYWCKKYPADEITVLDALTYAGNLNNISSLIESDKITFVKGDICDASLVRDLLRDRHIDTIVHFAAETHVDRSIHGPDAFVKTNIIGTHNLLEMARSVWLNNNITNFPHRFHHVSTDEVYGSLQDGEPAFHEQTPYDPSSPYSASKAASDHLVRAYQRTYGLDATISNCSNNYGSYHYPEKLIPLTIINIMHGKSIPVYGNGNNIRDWLYVEDHCRGIEMILKQGQSGHTYNIGGVCEKTNIEVVETLCSILDEIFIRSPDLLKQYPNTPTNNQTKNSTLITYVTDRPGHDWRYAMDISKISSELDFTPVETFESGLGKTVQWYLNNPNWWAPLLNNNYDNWLKVQYGSSH